MWRHLSFTKESEDDHFMHNSTIPGFKRSHKNKFHCVIFTPESLIMPDTVYH